MPEQIQGFHSQEGLFFQRLDNGSVRIVKTTDLHMPGEGNIAFEQTLDDGTWCSAVLSVSAHSERPNDWHKWMAHHKGEADVLAEPNEWREKLHARFVGDTDNGSGPTYLFRINADKSRSIALLGDVQRFIAELFGLQG